MTRPEQPTLEAAKLILDAVAEHNAKIDQERITLAWKTAKPVQTDWASTELFSSQGELFTEQS